jgi:hypothetical protein
MDNKNINQTDVICPDVFSIQTLCPAGCFVPPDVLSLDVMSPDVLSPRFFVWAPIQHPIYV